MDGADNPNDELPSSYITGADIQKKQKAGETSVPVKPQGQIQQQLAEAETQNTATAFPYHKYLQGLPLQSHNDRQQKTRNDSH
ncbi:transposase, IS605 OrfB family domain protein [Escherichia coli DEC10F]|nr:transposase, IS605 OrfB family domain protein [Escherichia coli DEC10F]